MNKISDLLPFKDTLIEYLKELGLEYSIDNRFEASFKEIEDSFRAESIGRKRDISRDGYLRNAIADLNELKFVIDSISKINISRDTQIEKFKRILANSTEDNDDSRNILFELALAAYFSSNNINVSCGDYTDLFLNFENKNICIECKRINSNNYGNSVKKSLTKANRQILKQKFKIDFGIIAIAIDKVYLDNKTFYTSHSELVEESFNIFLEEFINQYQNKWLGRRILNSSELIPAILVCIRGAVFIGNSNITGNAFYALATSTSTPEEKNFQVVKSLINLLKNN